MKNPLIGKKLLKVFVSENKEIIKFDLENHESITAQTDAECCSTTWIENVESPAHALNAIVTNVEDIEMPELPYDESQYDYLAFYGCKITTDKGSFVIDFRNSSNGYYGGCLSWPGEYGHYGNEDLGNHEWKEVN